LAVGIVSAQRRPLASSTALYRSAVLAWLVMALAEVLLYFRPTPSGTAYVLHWERYFFFALLYNAFAIGVVTLVGRLCLLHRPSPARERVVRFVHFALLLAVVGLDHADHEVQRFVGTHLTMVLAMTYAKPGAWGAGAWEALFRDRGGPLLGVLSLPLLLLLLVWLDRSRHLRTGVLAFRGRSSALLALLPVVSVIAYFTPGGWFRKYRVQPEVFTLAQEFIADALVTRDAAEVGKLAREWSTRWLSDARDRGWDFPDREHPFYRVPKATSGSPVPQARWNVVYVQLETFRGWNVGVMRPDMQPSPTPYLDSLARSPGGAYWTRHSSFGPPTVSGFVAGHCSIQPHSRLNITTNLTGVELDCLPALLRRHGYRTECFSMSDPDWDNETFWLQRWYDAIHFFREVDGIDRLGFRLAAARIRELGRAGTPFMATLISISNHYPFVSPEPELDLNAGGSPDRAIENTMRYTDDALREFIESLRDEPWFDHTVFVIVGDHGYNLAEHSSLVGERNGHREAVWVPLVVYGGHPQLSHGAHTDTSALIDVAPTIADLLGIREANSWMGHSLLRGVESTRIVAMERSDAAFAEDGVRRYVRAEHTGDLLLFDAILDPLELHNLAGAEPAQAARLAAQAHDTQVLVDGLLETDRIVPPSARVVGE
jgi:hypothetical protein